MKYIKYSCEKGPYFRTQNLSPNPIAELCGVALKRQMDVKYVPVACCVGTDGERFYRYTMLEEATRKRFIYACKEQSSYPTIDFVKRAICYFGYAPAQIQTDIGGEFAHIAKTNRIHPLDVLYKLRGRIRTVLFELTGGRHWPGVKFCVSVLRQSQEFRI